MYLYVRQGFEVEELPDALAKRVGQLTEVMSLSLSTERKLARVDVNNVMQALADQGFYLQMPPDGRVHARLYSGD